MIREQRPLSEKAADDIVQYILDGQMQPGDRLPSEAELTQQLQVGRGTVREAVKALISRNILTIRRGAGTYVAENFGVPDDPLGLDLMQDKRKLAEDLLLMRLLIEPEIAAVAAQQATQEEIATLEALCMSVEDHMRRRVDHITADQRFHTKIAECSKNSVAVKLFPLIRSSIEILVDITHSALREETMLTHRDILGAIRNHDPLCARDAMQMHLLQNKLYLKTRL